MTSKMDNYHHKKFRRNLRFTKISLNDVQHEEAPKPSVSGKRRRVTIAKDNINNNATKKPRLSTRAKKNEAIATSSTATVANKNQPKDKNNNTNNNGRKTPRVTNKEKIIHHTRSSASDVGKKNEYLCDSEEIIDLTNEDAVDFRSVESLCSKSTNNNTTKGNKVKISINSSRTNSKPYAFKTPPPIVDNTKSFNHVMNLIKKTLIPFDIMPDIKIE